MPGWDNGVSFGNAFRILESNAQDIAISQRLSTDIAMLNISGSPEGVVNGTPASFAHDRAAGTVYVKESGTGNTGWALVTTGTFFSTLPQYSVVLGTGSASLSSVGPTATAGQILQSAGNFADPVFSSSTYPDTTLGVGKILISDGSNFIESTATYPDTAAQGDILFASPANSISTLTKDTNATRYLSNTGLNNDPAWALVELTNGVNGILPLANGGTNANLTASNGGIFYSTATEGAILAGTATAGQILRSGSSSAPSWSTATYPSVAGTSGTLLTSNGTNWVNTTATYPGTSGTTGTILRSDGTNWVNTTATYPTTTTISQILYSSSANVIGEITTANNSILSTDGSGVPSFGTSLANDYSFTQATAGSSRVVTSSNTDNTNAASNASFNAVVGGASGGDAWHQVTVGTDRSYAFGIDNSDSDILKINTTNAAALTPSSGTNIWKMTSAGERTMPLQPAFQVYNNAIVTNVTGNGTVYTCVFNTETFDQGGDFASNTFTAPVTGRYQLSVVIGAGNIGASHTTGEVIIVTSNRSYRMTRGGYASMRDANGTNVFWGGSVLADMDAADTATVTLTVLNSTLTVTYTGGSGESTFSGFLAV